MRFLSILLLLILPLSLAAHKLETGQAILTLNPDRVWILELEVNLTRYIQSNPAFADTVRPEFRELERQGQLNDGNFVQWDKLFMSCESQFRKELEVQETEEGKAEFSLWFVHPSELPDSAFRTMADEGLHVKVHATGKLSSEEAQLQLKFPLDVGEVILTTIRPEAQWVVTGEWSDPIGFASEEGGREDESGIPVFRYLGIGFTHILPKGLDHILFVLGLFLLAARIRPLLIQVTAFTLAHTITLGLSIYGIISLPSSIVEPLIALSIAFVAIENILTDTIHSWRPIVVFIFGLLHGLGFAGVLSEIGLPRGEFLWALVSFNVGVELGQLAVLVMAFLLLGIFRKRDWYRRRISIPLSAVIGLVGLYWTVERIFF